MQNIMVTEIPGTLKIWHLKLHNPYDMNGAQCTELNLRGLQSVFGDPMYPSGQVQRATCPMTLQLALGAHAPLMAHGLIQFLFWHAE